MTTLVGTSYTTVTGIGCTAFGSFPWKNQICPWLRGRMKTRRWRHFVIWPSGRTNAAVRLLVQAFEISNACSPCAKKFLGKGPE
jgi:hypothetical protein